MERNMLLLLANGWIRINSDRFVQACLHYIGYFCAGLPAYILVVLSGSLRPALKKERGYSFL
jgi:hypothetical protein